MEGVALISLLAVFRPEGVALIPVLAAMSCMYYRAAMSCMYYRAAT